MTCLPVIKATSGRVQNGGKYLVYTDDRPNEKFCQYASVGDSYEHHSQFLKGNKRYSSLFKLSPDDLQGMDKRTAELRLCLQQEVRFKSSKHHREEQPAEV